MQSRSMSPTRPWPRRSGFRSDALSSEARREHPPWARLKRHFYRSFQLLPAAPVLIKLLSAQNCPTLDGTLSSAGLTQSWSPRSDNANPPAGFSRALLLVQSAKDPLPVQHPGNGHEVPCSLLVCASTYMTDQHLEGQIVLSFGRRTFASWRCCSWIVVRGQAGSCSMPLSFKAGLNLWRSLLWVGLGTTWWTTCCRSLATFLLYCAVWIASNPLTARNSAHSCDLPFLI